MTSCKFSQHLNRLVSQISPFICVLQQNQASQVSLQLMALILLAYWSLVWSGGKSHLRESVLQTAAVYSCVLELESCVCRGPKCSGSVWNLPPSSTRCFRSCFSQNCHRSLLAWSVAMWVLPENCEPPERPYLQEPYSWPPRKFWLKTRC